MSVTVDASVLVYASNEADPVHRPARQLIERLAAGPEIVYLFWPAIMGYLRIVTHPSLLQRPLGPAEAIANISALIALPHVRTPGEDEGSGSCTWRPATTPTAVTTSPTATSRR